MKTGMVNLPLHWGSAPSWLFERMVKLSRQIIIAMVEEYGPAEVLRRLSDPFWFQSFGCVLGFDWHSSGLTTTVCGALKESLRGLENDLGIFVCGGKGATSRKTPLQIQEYGEKYALPVDVSKLIYASKMSAKVDNTAVQDGYQLYHHTFIFTPDGKWAVIQQGMNPDNQMARRYHWFSNFVKEFVNEPHAAICAMEKEKSVLNMVSSDSDGCREISTEVAKFKPEKSIIYLKKISNFSLPKQHEIFVRKLKPESLNKIFLKTYENQPKNFEQLLDIPGVGPKTIRALALISELIYGQKPSFNDPAKFSFAHGGKDGHPYPIDEKQYDQSIDILRRAILRAKLGQSEKLEAIKRINS
jgi:hypothetical protein